MFSWNDTHTHTHTCKFNNNFNISSDDHCNFVKCTLDAYDTSLIWLSHSYVNTYMWRNIEYIDRLIYVQLKYYYSCDGYPVGGSHQEQNPKVDLEKKREKQVSHCVHYV